MESGWAAASPQSGGVIVEGEYFTHAQEHAYLQPEAGVAYMDEEALQRTLTSGSVWFYSRSRKCLWNKGETSGNRIKVHSVWQDCDADTILVKGKATGPVCHTGNRTCFFQRMDAGG